MRVRNNTAESARTHGRPIARRTKIGSYKSFGGGAGDTHA